LEARQETAASACGRRGSPPAWSELGSSRRGPGGWGWRRGLRRGAPDSSGVVGMERAVVLGSGRQPMVAGDGEAWRRRRCTCGGVGSGAALRRAQTAGRGGFGQRRADTGPVGHGAPLWRGTTAVPPRAANPGTAHGGLATDRRPHMSANFKYRKTRKFPLLTGKLDTR
jgi:hypothetical protein